MVIETDAVVSREVLNGIKTYVDDIEEICAL